ncbi:TVP38/TMEM64 family protein [Syntrophobacter fumaroxidans]|uniref:TVP38/TMEM64 family membrane protein n=1 Tax=Syntrophobacter fumaroxidans (strain DSM 10017 / MPOB) TaxID=335543 RepID=A0LKG7_SYNFM|nr:TVP38/TMEM64 family protein [Syntrophobacter fumaroxidans]ABK17919.1 conserved hypothetical protein [Syntrophobacter fumaroxidans MPOB]
MKNHTWKLSNVDFQKYGSRILLACLLFAAVAVSLFFLPVKKYVLEVLEWTRHLGPLGPLVVVLSFLVACVLPIPGSILAMGSGFLFGPFGGTATAATGCTLGACFAFILGRTIARSWVERRIAASVRLSAFDETLGDHGFKIIMLMRLSSVFPFVPLSYALGATRVSFRDHAIASAIGMFPIVAAYAYIGSAAGNLADVISGRTLMGNPQQFLYWGGLGVILVVVFLLIRYAGRAFRVAAGRARAVEDGADGMGRYEARREDRDWL